MSKLKDAFLNILSKNSIDPSTKKVLLIGKNDDTKTVKLALKDIDFACKYYIEDIDIIDSFLDADIIINTDKNLNDIDLTKFKNNILNFDYISLQYRSNLGIQSKYLHIPYFSKYYIEYLSNCLENGKDLDNIGYIDELVKRVNITLIGMPASGKTTIGKNLAEKYKKLSYDTDAEIKDIVKISIPEYFAQFGEQSFRDVEEKVIKNLSTKSGIIISVGGGAVLRETNMYSLQKNSIIVLVLRRVDNLSTFGRPLSKDLDTLKEMEKIRMPLYTKYADISAVNDGSKIDLLNKVLRSLYEDINY